jgi:Ca2+-binding EF-hand superfamily protein
MKIEKLLKTVTVAASSLCLMGSLAHGADLSQRGPISFNTYDTNKDGYINKSEFYDTRAKRQSLRANQGKPMKNAGNAPGFSLFDKNKDGKLTKLELLEGQNSQMKNNRLNKGQKGNSSRGMRRNMPTFESYDLNSDGHLTKNEMNKARSNRMGKNSTPFSKIDKNNDGKVSKVEFLTNQSQRR